MSFPRGAQVKVRFPGHVLHGKTVTVVEDVPDFEVVPDMPMRLIFVSHPSLSLPIGLHETHLAS